MRDKIKEIALKNFNTKGYAGTSIRDISKEVGITPASIYFYFKSKEELYFELLRDVSTKYHLYLEDTLKCSNLKKFEEQLQLLFNTKVEFALNNKDAHMFLMRSIMFGEGDVKERLCVKYKEWNEKLFEILSQTIDDENNFENMKNLMRSFTNFSLSYIMQLNYSCNTFKSIQLSRDWDCYWNGAKTYL